MTRADPSSRIGLRTRRRIDPVHGLHERRASGDAKTSSIVRIGAHGTAAASSASIHSPVFRVRNVSTAETRARPGSPRGPRSSRTRIVRPVGVPTTSHVRRKSRSLPAARMNGRRIRGTPGRGRCSDGPSPSVRRRGRRGGGSRPGSPSRRRRVEQRHADVPPRRARPLLERGEDADRGLEARDHVEQRHPAFTGSPSNSPVTLISPDSACTMMS